MKPRSPSQDTPAPRCDQAALISEKSRTDIRNRLRRAEGQLRGIQRMLEVGDPCADIATQMAAVRKALDSTYVRMTMCFMQEQMQGRPDAPSDTSTVLKEIEALLGKIR
ncbi:MAG: metal-sensing transcriptional repressor [Aquabacterium sp.]|uniref:metal-sensing transcriptional repressor n=1 Tax=Aquabacterium sp. TaxID=1872578 RepID=UPI0025BADF1F|nr:metal-sensing transcriptional repressor [Aquabacterium sp.]MBI3383946.1 metal-sensing transcriptional repressor [Aquabacterium sp.]